MGGWIVTCSRLALKSQRASPGAVSSACTPREVAPPVGHLDTHGVPWLLASSVCVLPLATHQIIVLHRLTDDLEGKRILQTSLPSWSTAGTRRG